MNHPSVDYVVPQIRPGYRRHSGGYKENNKADDSKTGKTQKLATKSFFFQLQAYILVHRVGTLRFFMSIIKQDIKVKSPSAHFPQL